MLYREYKQKLDKRLSIVAMLWRFRILILAAVLLLIALISTSIGVKGIIYSEQCPKIVTYGDHIQIKSKAFFCKTAFEYRTEGGDWSTEEPEVIGNYEIRAVSTRTGGKKVYGNVFSYEIVPAKVTVTIGNTMYFGDEPTLNAKLKYGDRFVTNRTLFSYSWQSFDTCNVYLDLSQIRVVNSQGKDVTHCYELTAPPAFVKVNPRPITLVVFGAEKIYDGNPLRSSSYEVSEGTLRDGDNVIIGFPLSITDVGEIDNTPTLTIIGRNGEDASKYYEINQVIGKLTVLPRELTIRTHNVALTYDGNEHHVWDEAYDVISEVGLAYGHSLVATESTTVCDAGTYPNAVKVDIVSGNKKVTSNYNINYEFGTVTVDKREIIIETNSASRVYNGEPLSEKDCKVLPSDKKQSGIAAGDNLRITHYTRIPTITDVGSAKNELVATFQLYSNLWGATEKDVTNNYIIVDYRYGTLTVTPRPLTIRTVTREWTYDGQPHYAKEFTVDKIGAETGLIVGHSLVQNEEITDFATITEIGTKTNYFNSDVFVLDYEMGKNVSRNYAISWEYGTLTVTKRPIKITTASEQWEYDGKAHSNKNYTIESIADNGGLIAGHRIEQGEITEFTEITDAGQLDNRIRFDFRIYDGNKDVTDKYTIDWDYGVLTVTRREISVQTATAKWYYDGNERYDDSYEITSGQLVDGHRVWALFTSVINAGRYKNEVGLFDIVDADGKIVTKNYSITYTFGDLTVLPREITIRTGSQTWIYDGLPHTCPEYTILPSDKEGYGLIDGHTLFLSTRQITDVTDTATEAQYVDNIGGAVQIFDKFMTNVTSNYDVSFEYGKLRIKAAIRIYLYSYKKYYDGEPLSFSQNDYTIVSKPVGVASVTIDLSNIRTLVDAGSVSIDEIRRDIIFAAYDASGNDVTAENGIYIEGDEYPLQVLKRRIEVKSISISKVNDGNPLYGAEGGSDKSAWISMGSLAVGHTVKIVVSGILLPHQSWCLNAIESVTVYDAEGNDVTDNYEITLNEGVLEWIPEKDNMG